ncbi:hypothetical protein CQY20_17955 [Mycolicibacterium agri]|uniref:Uncharacterized protein n=1 Tax=Mycolicibacterium agri TaxID=36811 RepID=A0A2A7MYL7_MYCAG|nr:hypothetical protein [Mycolicibacterium agri]PEG36650.1 hypothetical protein CQY20_17955 [Mycolicibacterium agri]GFG49180.1 hypothetical protein MAGR_06210 [Mycolicibacterium agri]
MVTVPAFVWRFDPVLRGVLLGLACGGSLGMLAWLDSGFLLVGVIVFVILAIFYGGWMTRRMSRYWPAAANLTGSQREQVARTARTGEEIGEVQLAPALIEYRDGMHAAAADARPLRWLLWFVLVVAVGTALWDTAYGSWGNAIASAIYLILLALEIFWWPRKQQALLVNTDRAAELARQAS